MGQRRRGILVALCVGILAILVTYSQASGLSPLADTQQTLMAAPVRGAGPAERGGRPEVSVIVPWAGADLDSFWAVTQPFAQRQGLQLSFESTPDVSGILSARVTAGTPPDIAIVPGVGLVQELAAAGKLVPLSGMLDVGRLAEEYPAGWLEAVSAGGELYGALYRVANESLVWYNPAEFQRRRWTVPLTWGDMLALSERIAQRGLSPWSLGMESATADGEPGTDWIENLILRTAGAETYDRWVRHEIPWTDEAVRQAFQRWGEIVGRPRNLLGGPSTALSTDSLDAVEPLYQKLPTAYLSLEGSYVQPLIARRFPGRVVEEDYDCFPLPPMSLQSDTPVVAGADIIVLFRDTPQARALLQYLTSSEAQAIWLQGGGFVAPAAGQNLENYPDSLSRRAARQVLEASTLRFDGSQQMPAPVADAFRDAVRDFVANPGRLDAILAGVERVAVEAYPAAHASATGWSDSNAQPRTGLERALKSACDATGSRTVGARGGASGRSASGRAH